jgi:2-polyprenyl-6-methoxyphenol hydroxylase-like FAD-dependent oxidoreductase
MSSVAIAGAGIAGLACAILLRALGWQVVVFDKAPRPAPVGSGLILQPVGLHVLDSMGVRSRINALGARIERLHGTSGGRTVLDVRYDARAHGAPCGLAVHRGALFQVLHDAAVACGVEIASSYEVVSAAAGRVGFSDGRQSARFDLVVDALGTRSPLSEMPKANLPYGALWASLDWCDGFDPAGLEQRYEAARKMAGVMPIGRLPGADRPMAAFFWSLRHDRRDAWRAASLEAWKDEVRTLWPRTAPLLQQIRSHEDLVFAAYAHRTLASPVSRECVHVGDSWHCTSPQLGQGANMALLDAYALALALGHHADRAAALQAYVRLRRAHVRLYQTISRVFTPAYQSDSQTVAQLRDWLLAPASRLPPVPRLLAALVAGQWGRPLARMEALAATRPQAFPGEGSGP